MKQIKTYINEKLRLTNKHQYTCQPKDKDELEQIILQRIKDEGLTCDLNDIDVSKIKDMSYLFYADAANGNNKIFKKFNGDISQWNVSKVKSMHAMFDGCKQFNCDISKWDVQNVKDMQCMFSGCKKFDCDLSMWNVSNVKNMYYAFENCPTQPDWYDKNKWVL
jgi:surface protein